MELTIYQADAFAADIFAGNPAAVVPLESWLPDKLMQNIALENNLSETAFFVEEPEGLRIRWFTPAAEVALCGHATLASAHILFNHLGFDGNEISFNSLSGVLRVERSGGLLWLDFPASKLKQVEVPGNLIKAVGFSPIECWRGRDDFMLVFDNEETIRSISPDFLEIQKSECRGLIVTAPGNEVDFVSRFFAPKVGVNEDPVTGSSHTILIPYWSEKFGKKKMEARQISKRSGHIRCIGNGSRVKIGGKAVTYLVGKIWV